MTAPSLGAAWWHVERLRRRLYRTHAWQSGQRRLPIAAPPLSRPIFLLGTVRSGTTFFSRSLGRHPQVLYAGFELSREWIDAAGVEIAGPGLPCAHCLPATTTPDVDAARRELAEVHRRKGGWHRTRLLNKNPHLWNKVPLIRRLFPDAAFIVTSRDVVSTAASTRALWEKMHRDWGVRHYLPEDTGACWSCAPPGDDTHWDPARVFPGGAVEVLAEYWLRVYERLDRDLATAPRTDEETAIVVRHPQLLADPSGALAGVLASLGLAPLQLPFPEPVDRRRNRRWRALLDDAEVARLRAFLERHANRVAALRSAENEVPEL